MRALQDRFPIIGDVRGRGLLMGVELVRNRQTMERARDEAEEVMYHCLSNGLNFKLTMGNIVTLTPALTITRPEMDRALQILESALEAVSKKKMVGATGFEPATSCSQSKCSSQAELRSDAKGR